MENERHHDYIERLSRYVLDYRLIRHPIIIGAAILFVISLIFFTLGTIKFQSLAIDIDKQGKEALERSLSHINLVSKGAESSINEAKQISLRNINAAEIAEVENLKKNAKPIITKGLQLIRTESEKVVDRIQSEGDAAISSRLKELQLKIDTLKGDLEKANRKITELQEIKLQIEGAKPEINQLLNDWESIKNQGQSWKEALVSTIDNWRELILELFIIGVISVTLSYIIARRKGA